MVKTGFSRLCINPPIGTPICSYYEKRYTKGILDNIYATSLAFDDGERKIMIIALDILVTQKPKTYHLFSDFV